MLTIDEFKGGDLSSNALYPSRIKIKKSKNKKFFKVKLKGRVYNSLGDDPTLDARDLFTFRVPKNRKLKSIKLNKYDNSSYEDNTGGGGWLGVAKGDSISDLNDPGGLIGGHLIGVAKGAKKGDQILDELEKEFDFNEMIVPALRKGAISNGRFTFWFQEGNPAAENSCYVDYTMTFKFGLV